MTLEKFNDLGVRIEVFGSDFNFREIDGEQKLAKQIECAFASVDLKPKLFCMGRQAHTVNVVDCKKDRGEPYAGGLIFDQVDGLITDQPGVALVVKTADCAPIVIFDPRKRVLAAVHSGWRGTAGRIAALAIDKMCGDFGCRVEDLKIFLGPMIDKMNYEVGLDVYRAFADFGEARQEFFSPSLKNNDKFLLDMAAANVAVLNQAGVDNGQIEISKHSTFSNEKFHSARRQGESYGLNGVVAMVL